MVQTADFGNLQDRARLGELDGSDVGGVLVEREVRVRLMIVLEVPGQGAAQVSFAKNENMIQTLAPDRTDEPLGAAASGPGDPVAPCSTNAANSSEQSVRLPATEVPMRLIGLAVLLAVSPSLAPLPVSAQKAERVSRVGYLRSGSVRGWSGAGRRKDREVGEAYGYERPAEDAVCDRSYRRQPHRGSPYTGPPGGDFLLNLQRRSLADRDTLGVSLRGLSVC